MTNSVPLILNSNMSDMVAIRDARKEDAAGIAAMIVYAWPVEEFLKMKEGLTAEEFTDLIRVFAEAEDTLYSYRYTKVAVVPSEDGGERIVGAMNGYDGAMYRTLKQPILDTMIREFGSAGDFSEVVETEAGEFYLDSIGVDPGARSMGIGSKLFQAMLEKASAEGFRVAGLIVDEDKPKAEALYLRLGFTTVGYRDFLGHRMKHMQINL